VITSSGRVHSIRTISSTCVTKHYRIGTRQRCVQLNCQKIGIIRSENWKTFRLNRHAQLDRVIGRMSQVLLGAKVPLGRLDRGVT
jgi:hypothetical protein